MQALAMDSSDCLHAAWAEQATPALKRICYSRRPADSVWTEPEVVAESANNNPVIVAEPASGRVHCAWTSPTGTTNDVWYATNRSGAWQRTNLTSDTIQDWTPTIALEDDTLAHLAWVSYDSARAYRIKYASNRSGTWRSQILAGSQLGGFGSGAAPWLALEPNGVAHAVYRGGDYGDYHIHHAQNSVAGDTAWSYEILYSQNLNDFASGLAAHDSGELFAVVSGNDGWGMPFRTCYLHRPAGSQTWDPYQLMTASTSASMRGFAMDGSSVHATWERINGNVNTEEIYHCSNFAGYWWNSALRADQMTSGGALVLDATHCGHALVLVDDPTDSVQVYCVHSAPLTGISEAPARPVQHRQNLAPLIVRAPVHFSVLETPARTAALFDPTGRTVERLPVSPGCGRSSLVWNGCSRNGRPMPAGVYFLQLGTETHSFLLLR